MFPGRFPRVRARLLPSAIANASFNASLLVLSCERSAGEMVIFNVLFLLFFTLFSALISYL